MKMSIHGIVKHKFLKDLVTLKKGKKAQNVYIKQLPETVPYILIESFNHNIAAYTDATDMVLCKPEDILIVWDGARAGLSTSGHSGAIGSTIAKLEIKNKNEVYPKYLYQFISSKYERLNQNTHGAAIPHLNKYFLEGLDIPLPNLPAQRRIASILETCEAAIQKRKQANRLSDEFLKSTFFEMFGDPLENQKGWSMIPLNEISLFKGQYGSGAAAVVFDPAKPRYIRITDINEDGTLNSDVVSPSTDASEWNEYILDEGDILFARSGATVGKTFRYRKADGFCVFAGYLIRFKPNTKIVLPDYLFYFTRTIAFRAWIESKKKVVAQPNINAKQYGTELLVPSPSLSEQQKFADIVQKVESLKQKQHESEKELTNLFNSLMQRAFRGEL